MIESWFDTDAKVARLQFAAASWIGTPFFPNSSTRGPRGGVSCQKLAEQLYMEVGCHEVKVPEGPINHARFSQTSEESLIEKYMDGLGEWRRVALEPRGADFWMDLLRAGDLLGFRIYKAVHHCGVLLSGPVFIHALDHVGAAYASLSDGTWSSRLAVAWRRIK